MGTTVWSEFSGCLQIQNLNNEESAMRKSGGEGDGQAEGTACAKARIRPGLLQEQQEACVAAAEQVRGREGGR